MIWPVCPVVVALRLPLTAAVEVTPSFAAFPPNRFTTRPSVPPNSRRVFWSARTSAPSVCVDRTSRLAASAPAIALRFLISSTPQVYVVGN
jgi:hypothetical protein